MPETIEEWLWFAIAVLFIGFVIFVIAVFFHLPVGRIGLGIFACLIVYALVRIMLVVVKTQRQRQRIGANRSWQYQLPVYNNGQKQQISKNAQQQRPAPEIKKPTLENPTAQNYTPPGLPPDLFL